MNLFLYGNEKPTKQKPKSGVASTLSVVSKEYKINSKEIVSPDSYLMGLSVL